MSVPQQKTPRMQPVQQAAPDAMRDGSRPESEMLQLIPRDHRVLLGRHDADEPIDVISDKSSPPGWGRQRFMAA